MTEREQRSKTITLLLAAALVLAALILHNIPARAQVNCQLVTVSYPSMQISMVSKVCWEKPNHIGDLTEMVAPAAIPLPPDKPKCRMKGRVWWNGGCWLPRRIPK